MAVNLLVSKTRLHMKNTPISNLSHNVVSGTSYHERDSNSVIFTDYTYSCKSNYHAIKTTTTPFLILIKFKFTSVVHSNIPIENIWTESDDYTYQNFSYIHDQHKLTNNNKDTGKKINSRENRRDNQEWTIQRNWQHRVH